MEASRFQVQERLPFVGPEGQQRLGRASVLLVGCGALGCTIADLLVRAGVGRLTIVDRDVVEASNLHRQSLFTERDAAEAMPKAEAARRRLGAAYPAAVLEALVVDLTPANAQRLVDRACPDVILDGTDNFETRYLLNDLAVALGVPYGYGGVVGTRGTQMTVIPHQTPCLRCIADHPPTPGTFETCEAAGVFAPAAVAVAAWQAADAFKLLLGRADLVAPVLREVEMLSGQVRTFDLAGARRPDCPCCVQRRFEYLDGVAAPDAVVLCGHHAVQLSPPLRDGAGVDLRALAERLAPHGTFRVNEYVVRGELVWTAPGVPAPLGLTVFADGRVIVSGTDSAQLARAICARFVGV